MAFHVVIIGRRICIVTLLSPCGVDFLIPSNKLISLGEEKTVVVWKPTDRP